MGIYIDNGDTPAGGALQVETASVGCATIVQELTIASTQLDAGLYWLAWQFDNTTVRFGGGNASSSILEANSSVPMCYYARGGGYGALTDPCPAITAWNQNPPLGYLRVASIP